MSCTALNPLSQIRNARKYAFELGKQFDPTVSFKNSSSDLLYFLQGISASNMSKCMFPVS